MNLSGDARARQAAAGQAGVIHRRQLRGAGLTDRQIHVRIRRGELIRQHPCVYRFAGSSLSFRARVWAALLAAGPGAFASHWTAAVLWGMRRREPELIDLTVCARHRRRVEGARVHLHKRGPAPAIRSRDGIRLSSPSRAVCELAATAHREDVEYAIQEAAARGLLTPGELEVAAERWGARHGAAMLHSILQTDAGGDFPRSRAERRLQALIRRAGLPRPEKNVHILGHRCDAVWPAQRLIVEVDGLGTHGTPVAFASDRAMDAELTLAGWRVLRFTARQLEREPLLVAAQLAQALGSRR